MEIRNLVTFLKVTELNSFSKAAEALDYSQSAVTVQIQQLERELGVRLFDRIGKNVSITQYGKNFISYARDIVSAVARAQVFASEETELTGMVQVGTLNSLMTASFSDIVPAFRQRFPHVMMRLHADMVASLKDKLLKNELDLIYTLDSQVLDPQFVKVFEAEEEVVVVTNRDNPLAARESVRLAELVDRPFILMNRTNAYRDLFDTELARQGLFDRIGKNVSITQYGKNFISYARDIVSAVARAQVFASEETELTGMVQVGTLNSLMTASFSDIVPAFRQRFPHVMMRLHADMVASLKDKLLKNELDLIYTLDSQVLDPQFVKVFEAEEEVVVVTNRDNPLAARESVRLAELVDRPFILMNRTNAYRDLFDTELARQGLEIRPFLELEDDVLALRLLYENPAYMTVLPLYTVKKSIHEKSLAAVRVEDCKMSQFRQVIYHKNKVLTPQIQGMLDTIVEVAKRPF